MRRTAEATLVRAAIYCRKSVARGLDREVNSLTTQREACEAYCRSQGWEVVPTVYSDGGFTGRNTERPAFQALMRDAAAGRFDRVVVYKLDRLSRSLADFVATVAELERVGVGFTAVTQSFDTSTALGRLTMGILASFASFESDLNSERTRDAIAAARRKGKWTGGKRPLGYDVVDGALVVNAAEAVAVREAFDIYLERESAVATARELNGRGRRLKSGARWKKASALRLLRNPIVVGLMPAGDDIVDGQHDAIVDRDVWDRAQALLDSRREQSRPKKTRNVDYLVGGLIKCGQCGSSYTPASNTKRGKTYRYYRCTTRDREGREACPGQPLPAASVEGFVVARIAEVAASPHLVADVTARLLKRIEEERVVLANERGRLPQRIAGLTTELGKLVDRLVDIDGAAARAMETRIGDRTREREGTEQRLAEVERQLAALNAAEVGATWVAETLADFDRVWALLTAQNRRRLVEALVSEVIVDTVEASITVELVDVRPVAAFRRAS